MSLNYLLKAFPQEEAITLFFMVLLWLFAIRQHGAISYPGPLRCYCTVEVSIYCRETKKMWFKAKFTSDENINWCRNVPGYFTLDTNGKWVFFKRQEYIYPTYFKESKLITNLEIHLSGLVVLAIALSLYHSLQWNTKTNSSVFPLSKGHSSQCTP